MNALELLKLMPREQQVTITNGIKSFTEGFNIRGTAIRLIKENSKYIKRTVEGFYITSEFDWDNEEAKNKIIITVCGVA